MGNALRFVDEKRDRSKSKSCHFLFSRIFQNLLAEALDDPFVEIETFTAVEMQRVTVRGGAIGSGKI